VALRIRALAPVSQHRSLPYAAPMGRIPPLFSAARDNRVPSWSSLFVANIKSAEKRARQTVKRRAHNASSRSRLRTAIKNVVVAVEAGNKDEAVANLKVAVPVIDTMVNKGIIHRNKAARHKSQLNARVKELSVG
jgi:small subunit ribosomal protein S20